MTRSEDDLNARLERILGPTGQEVSCEQCFELLDEFVELEIDGADVDARLPGLRTHLLGCPACREDHESLHAFLTAQASGA